MNRSLEDDYCTWPSAMAWHGMAWHVAFGLWKMIPGWVVIILLGSHFKLRGAHPTIFVPSWKWTSFSLRQATLMPRPRELETSTYVRKIRMRSLQHRTHHSLLGNEGGMPSLSKAHRAVLEHRSLHATVGGII